MFEHSMKPHPVAQLYVTQNCVPRCTNSASLTFLNRTGFIGGPIPREDGPDAPTQQVLPRVA